MSKLTNEEEAIESVKQFNRSLLFLPDELKTAKVCLEAVKQYGSALQFVPVEIITEEICLETMKTWFRESLEYVPKRLWNKIRSTLASELSN